MIECCDKPFLINQEVLDSLEARGHAVKLVDNFGSVVVGIGQYFRDMYLLIVLLIIIPFQSGEMMESCMQTSTSEKLVPLLDTNHNHHDC